jgi:predicted lysophospholipase L1 biosynthesis ABC-type transport system permease subunit
MLKSLRHAARMREIGIRMAIGADRMGVIRMILKQGLVLSLVGVAAGLVVSFFACRVLTSSLWIATFDHTNPVLFLVISLPLLLITLLATYAPAPRASLVDPMKALRDELANSQGLPEWVAIISGIAAIAATVIKSRKALPTIVSSLLFACLPMIC